jgi:siroheme synthase
MFIVRGSRRLQRIAHERARSVWQDEILRRLRTRDAKRETIVFRLGAGHIFVLGMRGASSRKIEVKHEGVRNS